MRVFTIGGARNFTGRWEGWSIYLQPTTGQPKYVEVRYRNIEGRLIHRFKVERDGTSSMVTGKAPGER